MKQFLIAGASLLVLTSASLAADMPPAPVPEAYVAPGYDWSGAYVGIHGGWGWGEIGSDDFDALLIDFSDLEGFVIGGQIGYNWVWDSILFGLEGDGSFSDLSDDFDDFGVDGGYLASIRGRLGFAADRFLIYGTGGAAFAGASFDDTVDDDIDTDHFGWVAGGGVEYAITDNLTIGVEYLHYEFGDEDFVFGPDDINADLTVDVVRGRLNFKFDSIFN